MFHVISPLPTLCQADVKAPGTAKRTPFLPAENMWLNVVDPNSFIKHHMNSLRDHTSLQRPLDHHAALQRFAKQGEHLQKHWGGSLHQYPLVNIQKAIEHGHRNS